MDSLPEECLELILHSIPPHRPLHPLLLVSRTFFRLVVPILYQNPFDYIDRVLFCHHNANQRKIMALSLLLLSSPEPLFEGLTLKPGGWQYKSPATVDYLSFYTRHSERHFANFISLIVPNNAAQTPSPSVGGRDSSPPPPSSSSSSSAIVSIRKRVHKGFVGHSASHIQSLCFSMYKLHMLLSLVPQLSALARLELYILGKVIKVTDAKHFITSHLQHHPGVLREIKIDAPRSMHTGGLYIASHIEALGTQAQVIDVTGWIDGALYLNRFPSEECKSLLLRHTVPAQLRMPKGSVERFRKLERLRFPALDAGLFAWAVAQEHAPENLGQRSSVPMLPRPPLASLDLHGPDDHLIPVLSDATNAFRDTMVEIKGLSSFGQSTGRALEWAWGLPRLTHLDLEGTVAVRFDLQSLRHCPALRELRLNIGRQIPETWVPAVKARELAECLSKTQVTTLELSGYWDVSDADLITEQGGMLPVLKKLTRLNLMWCRGPTIAAFEFLMREMSALKRLHVSGTLAEEERLLELKKTLGLEVSLDIEARG
ncbi:hypothetical protein BG005_001736 [Podila minutissima]|nr:hypothetical protein BG005_001736 [Podila minutissima]